MSALLERLDEVRAMPWGGARNVALRELLVGEFGDVWSTHLIDGRGAVLATTADAVVAGRAAEALGGRSFGRPDGTVIVQVEPSSGG